MIGQMDRCGLPLQGVVVFVEARSPREVLGELGYQRDRRRD
jgi:hypothetical protein